MEKKKNPKVDIEKRKTGIFLLGLVIALSSSIAVINLKWKEISLIDKTSEVIPFDDSTEIQPKLIKIVPKVRKPVSVIVDKILISEPIAMIEEQPDVKLDIPLDVEVSDNIDDLIEIEDIIPNDEIDHTPVPYELVGKFPMFKNCEHLTDLKDQKSCFQDGIMRHISENFRYPTQEKQMGIEGKVFISFVISRNGTVENIRTKGNVSGFKKEAERLINSLPQFTPAEQRKKRVNMSYSIPINFKIK